MASPNSSILYHNTHFDDLLKVTHTEWGLREQVEDPQPRLVTETFVDPDQSHAGNIRIYAYKARELFRSMRAGSGVEYGAALLRVRIWSRRSVPLHVLGLQAD